MFAHPCSELHYLQQPEGGSNPRGRERMNKQKRGQSVCTTDYYSALKRKEILTPATAWMNHEDIMLSEISESPKA